VSRDVLVDGYTLLVGSDERPGVRADDEGLFHRDTRHLSALSITLDEADLGTIGRDLAASNRRQFVSADVGSGVNRVDQRAPKRTDVVVRTDQAVGDGVGLATRITVDNYAPSALSATLSVATAVDFADVFEVRGFAAELDRSVSRRHVDGGLSFAYTYEMGDTTVRRTTAVGFDPDPAALADGTATFHLDLSPGESGTVDVRAVPGVTVDPSGALPRPQTPEAPPAAAASGDPALGIGPFETGRDDYDQLFARAAEDLAALTAETPEGPVPLAGTPWFATVFGRDALITAYQTIPVAPRLARGTLRHLAAHQGTATNPDTEEEPGKVFHEMRDGELARRGLVPHAPYYGSIDATPLWVVLLAELWQFTRTDALVEDLAESLEAALSWIERSRTGGGDPFLYYEASPAVGLEHKAWRDTPGSVQFPDGREATTPIASVEVQGYVYRALLAAATLHERVLGDPARAATLRERAGDLADAFESTFWRPAAGYYALAKDGNGRVVPTVTSNVGHCLLTGIVSEERTSAVARTLLSEDLFSGWGVRTVGTAARGYSPLSYHLGSVWPHDTSLAAMGLARAGHHEAAERLARGVLDACTRFDDVRIPELFCGLDDGVAPTPFPASCVPQAWSAGAPFALLRAVFDLSPTPSGIEAGRQSDLLDRTAIEPILDNWNR